MALTIPNIENIKKKREFIIICKTRLSDKKSKSLSIKNLITLTKNLNS
jgi:hypothetical protein